MDTVGNCQAEFGEIKDFFSGNIKQLGEKKGINAEERKGRIYLRDVKKPRAV